MKLIYIYSLNCGSCKDYEPVVDRLSTELKISCEKQNIEAREASYKVNGVPTLILEDNGVEIFRNVGNLPYKYLIENVRKYIN